jgi:hypothetical protein
MHTRATRRRLPAALLSALVATALITPSTAAQPVTQSADLVENDPVTALGNEPTLRAEEATLTRHQDRLAFEVRMDTPAPGTYVYPDDVPDVRQAAPEVFTAWAFVFNYPENCVSADEWPNCGGDDFSDSVKGGVYGVAGHLTAVDHEGGGFVLDRDAGGQVILRGEIAVGDPQRTDLPPGATTFALENPLGAEVHFAIAPHGQLDPATVATELYDPKGDPPCGCWWVAFFSADGEGA